MAYLPCTPQLYCVFLYKRFSLPPIAKAEHPLRNSKQFLLLGSILVSGNLHLGPQFSSFFLFVNCLFFIFSEVESMNKNSSFLPSHLLIVRHCVYLHMHTPPNRFERFTLDSRLAQRVCFLSWLCTYLRCRALQSTLPVPSSHSPST